MTRGASGDWRRRDVLAGAGAAALFGAHAAAAQGAPRIGLPLSLLVDSGTLFNARVGNHLAGGMAGAAIERVPDSAAVIAGLRAGDFAVGQILALELLRDAVTANEPLISIATLTRYPPSLYGLKRNLPEKPERLGGKTIAVPADVAEADAYLSLHAMRGGVDPARIRRIPAAHEIDAIDLVLDKKVDGAVVTFSMTGLVDVALSRRGMDARSVGLVRYTMDAFRQRLPGLCFVATRKTADASSALLLDFVRGLLASAREQIATSGDKDGAVAQRLRSIEPPARKELVVFMTVNAGMVVGRWRMAGDLDQLLRHDAARWAAAADLAAKAGIGDVRPKLDALYTNRFADAALKG